MQNFEKNIDKMISKILKEEIEIKSKTILERLEEGGEWTEIEVDEELHGGQKKLDKNKNGKIDAEDFKLLRKKGDKKEMDEFFFNDEEKDNSTPGDYEGDEEAEDEAEELSAQEPTYVGRGLGDNKWAVRRTPKFIGSFDDKHGWFDDIDSPIRPDVMVDYEEEEFPDFDSLMASPYAKIQRWFAPTRSDGKKYGMVGDGRRMFDLYQKQFGGKPFRIRKPKVMDEAEIKGGKDKLYGSFDDEHGWFDEKDYSYKGNFDFDYDEEEFPDFDSLMASPYAEKQLWFAPERSDAKKHGMVGDGRRFFDLYQKKFGGKPFRIRKMKVMDEAETEEGNAFTGALEDAKEKGKKTFEVDGKTFPVKEGKEKKCPKCGMTNCKCNHKKETNEKWKGDVEVKQTGEYSDMSIEDLNKAIKKQKAKNDKTKEAGKKVSDSDRTKMSQLYFAKRAKQGWKGKAAVKENLQLTEEELIDLIENIVKEQKVKDVAEKNNITTKKAEGLKKTEKVLKADKKENDDYAKQVVKKMKEYVKAGSLGEYNESPENFPESNYSMSKMKEKTMKYHPSKAVDEYIEAFAFPGMTNLVYDEIKPDDEKIKKYIKGDRTTGNAEVDEEGKALGNVVPSEVGERFMKNYEDNLYGAEQMNVSYKRQPQPVDVGGSDKMEGSLKSIRKGSTQKAQKIMNQLESKEKTTENVITEEMSRMMNLISYNKKTQ